MSDETISPRSRRSLLAAGIGGAAAAFAAALGRPAPVSAVSNVLLGEANSSSTPTSITNTGGGQGATGIMGQSASGTGIYGYTTAGAVGAVVGRSGSSSTGVYGLSTTVDDPSWPQVPDKTGVYGYAIQDSAAIGVKGESTSGTGVVGTSTSGPGIRGTSTTSSGVMGMSGASDFPAPAVFGASTGNGVGVQGVSSSPGTFGWPLATGTGVHGYAIQDANSVGVHGQSTGGTGVRGTALSGSGVRASSASGLGVFGESVTGTGICGYSGPVQLLFAGPPASTGVYGTAVADASARGVHGATTVGQGVRGDATTGVGGYFAAAIGGTALQVAGKARFSRSGKATVAAGKSYADITVAGGLSATSVVHATLQSYHAGVAIAAVRANYPSAGKARIYLTKVASTTSRTYVGWFVTEY